MIPIDKMASNSWLCTVFYMTIIIRPQRSAPSLYRRFRAYSIQCKAGTELWLVSHRDSLELGLWVSLGYKLLIILPFETVTIIQYIAKYFVQHYASKIPYSIGSSMCAGWNVLEWDYMQYKYSWWQAMRHYKDGSCWSLLHQSDGTPSHHCCRALAPIAVAINMS